MAQIALNNDKVIKHLESKLTFKDLQDKLHQASLRKVMLTILPALCKSSNFVSSNLSSNKDKLVFVKVVLELLYGGDDLVVIGLECVMNMNDYNRELLMCKAKAVVEVV